MSKARLIVGGIVLFASGAYLGYSFGKTAPVPYAAYRQPQASGRDQSIEGGWWTAFIYPDRRSRVGEKATGPYRTFQECVKGARATLRADEVMHVGTYECAMNCRRQGNRNICKRYCRE